MKLAVALRVSATAGIDMELVGRSGAARLRDGVVRRGLWHRCGVAGRLGLGADDAIKAGTSILQMPARTPACAAMTAMTLQALCGNRFLCGIGPSGPQVVEGWHGVPFGKPLARTREYIAIIRLILERKAPLEFAGEHYQSRTTGRARPASASRSAASSTATRASKSTPRRSPPPDCGQPAKSPTGPCRFSCRPSRPRRSSARCARHR